MISQRFTGISPWQTHLAAIIRILVFWRRGGIASPATVLAWEEIRPCLGWASHDLVLAETPCYNGTVYYAYGGDEVKPAGRKILGTDPLTTILAWVAFALTAAIAALGVDLWLQPEDASPAAQVSALGDADSLGLVSPVDLTPTPGASPTPTEYAPAVRIRIPAIGVDRSIVEVPLAYDPRSEDWARDVEQLFRPGRQDLVGHFVGSASPGQPGNMILVGHNYGYGVNGVFLRLGRLEAGQQVQIVNAAGETFTYRVTEVNRVQWTEMAEQEILEHQTYLSLKGPERLTLVTCGGSAFAPFPERVYVIAAPAD